VWTYDSKRLHSVLSVQLDVTVARAISFSSNVKELHVFGLFDGQL
jgi:hypothetical protein